MTSYREGRLMCCPSIKFIKGDTRRFLALGGQHEDKLFDTSQVMAPTNVKTVNQTSLLHIESNLDRLGLLSPTHGQRSQQQTGQIPLQSVLINKPEFLKARHDTEKEGKLKYRGPWLWRPWASETGERASIQPSKTLCIPEKAPRILPVRRSLLALAGRKETVVRDRLFPQKPSGSRLIFWSRDVGSAVSPRVAERILRLLTGSSPPSHFPRRYASFGAMHVVGTSGMTCGFNWQCTANDIGYTVSWSQHAWTLCRLLTSTVWIHFGRAAARAGRLCAPAQQACTSCISKRKPPCRMFKHHQHFNLFCSNSGIATYIDVAL